MEFFLRLFIMFAGVLCDKGYDFFAGVTKVLIDVC
jgi:hypothetical protein